MEIKRKRRRLEENKVSRDFNGTVPGFLYRYLKCLKEGKTKDDYELWGYTRVLDFSKEVTLSLEDDTIIVLGINNKMTSEMGRRVFLMYSKVGYPDKLIHVIHGEDGNLTFLEIANTRILS